MQEAGLRVIDLDELVKPVAKVRLKGQEHEVRPITGRAYSRLVNARAQGPDMGAAEQLTTLRALVKDIVPTLPDDVLEDLTLGQLLEVLTISGEGVTKVQRLQDDAGKVAGPAPVVEQKTLG